MQKINLVRTYLAAEWCSGSTNIKKTSVGSEWVRLMSEGVRLGLDMKSG